MGSDNYRNYFILLTGSIPKVAEHTSRNRVLFVKGEEMKKKLIALIATIMLLLFTLCGCERGEMNERFFIVEELGNDSRIVCDRETGVLYFYSYEPYQGAMTVLLDKDGKPLLYEGELK